MSIYAVFFVFLASNNAPIAQFCAFGLVARDCTSGEATEWQKSRPKTDRVEKEQELKLLIEGCVRNERKSQEKLFQLFYGKMMVVCLRYCSDRDTAQEVLQEGFIKIFEKLEHFDYKGSFEGWIRRIIANTAIDTIRKSKKLVYVENEDYVFQAKLEHPMEEQEIAEWRDLKANIAMEAIEQLSPAYKTVFNLYVIEEFSHKEIAEILGISEGTSKSNLAKAKQNLQRLIEKRMVNFD